MTSPSHQSYRPDVDGLRAIAVLVVVAFHAFPGKFRGGFIGVDIFFVISGYLISGIIFGGLERQTFSFREFYARRIKRIFPALLLVFAASMLLGWFVLLGGEYKQLGKHVAAGAAFVSNLVLWGEAGYFDATAESKVLLHLWSLGIEEQFYLLWPLTLFIAAKRRWSAPWIITALMVASFVLNVARVRADPVGTFYSPVTRFWELFAGALLSWASTSGRAPWLTSQRGATLRSFVGAAMIGAVLLLVRKESAFPGWWALLPVGGAALLISAGPRAWVNRYVLSNRAMVFVGLISYPLYVWHWPLLVFAQYVDDGEDARRTRLVAVAAAFVLAWLTTRFVERPIRSGRPSRALVAAPAAAMTVMAVLGALVLRYDGFPARLKGIGEYEAYFDNTPPERRYFREHDIPRNYRFDCDFYDIATKAGKVPPVIDATCYTPHSARSVVLWGDSHAQQFYYGLSVSLAADVSILPLATSACPPSLTPSPLAYCTVANEFARTHIEELKPDVVVLAQAKDHERADFEGLVAWLTRVGVKHVVVMGPVPQWQPDLYKVIARHYWPEPPARIQTHLSKSAFAADRALRARMAGRAVTFVSVIDQLCNEQGCLAYLDGDRREGLTTFDYGHLSARGSAFVVKGALEPALAPLLRP